MSSIAVIANLNVGEVWARELEGDGRRIEIFTGYRSAEELFSGPARDIVIIDIENPEWPESLLIPQTRAIWPDCRIIAVVSNYAFRKSAVYEMGLWQPDQVLMKPLATRILSATVNFLWAQQRTAELQKVVSDLHGKAGTTPKRPPGLPSDTETPEQQPPHTIAHA